MGKASYKASFRREDQKLIFRHVNSSISVRLPSVDVEWAVGDEGLEFGKMVWG